MLVSSQTNFNLCGTPRGDSDMPAMLKVLETANMHYVPSEEMPELGGC